MVSRNVSLLIFWLLATAICVAYVVLTTGPSPRGFSVSSRQDDLRLRDRPLRSWGPYLRRRIPDGKVPETAIAKAPPPLSEHTTIKSFVEPKQRTLEVKAPPPVSETIKSFAEPKPRTPELPPPVRKVPYSPDNPAAEVGALLGAEDEQLEPPLKRSAARAENSKPTAKLSGRKKKVIAERAPQKSRFARRRGGRGLGLFALSGDFGRPY
jgi:hypothetical protein